MRKQSSTNSFLIVYKSSLSTYGNPSLFTQLDTYFQQSLHEKLLSTNFQYQQINILFHLYLIFFRFELQIRGLMKKYRDCCYKNKTTTHYSAFNIFSLFLKSPNLSSVISVDGSITGRDFWNSCLVGFSWISSTSWNVFPFMFEEEKVVNGEIWRIWCLPNQGNVELF